MTPRPRLLLYPFEWLALAAAAATIVFLRAHGLRVGWRALELTLPPMFARLPAILGAGLLVHALATVARRGALRAYLAGFLRPASIVLWLRVSFAFMLVTFAYAWLKVCVPLVNRSVWDAALWRLERALHLGFAPNVFAVELVSGTPLLPALDLWYSLWLATVFLAWAWAAAHSDLALRRNFVFGCALLSIAGSWLYLALPALGPCYALPELFDGVRGELPRAAAVQDALAANYAKMIAGRDGSLRQFNPYLGVAALPSLHVGAHWFFALWAKRHARRLYLPWAIATALTFFGALATGWHYAVDGYAGLLLAWGVFALGERLEPTTDASGSGKAEPTPAAGDETLRTASAPAASRPESGGTA